VGNGGFFRLAYPSRLGCSFSPGTCGVEASPSRQDQQCGQYVYRHRRLLASVLITVGAARRTHSSAMSKQDYWAIRMMREHVVDPSGAVLNAGIVQLPNGAKSRSTCTHAARHVSCVTSSTA